MNTVPFIARRLVVGMLLVQSVVTLTAFQGAARPGSQNQVQKPDSTKPPAASVDRTLIRGLSSLVLDKKTKGQGLVKVSGPAEGCSPAAFEGKVTTTPGFGNRGPDAFIMLLFLQGVRHEIQGEICWPTIGLEVHTDATMQAETATNKDGKFVSTGAINVKGTLLISEATGAAEAKGAKVFRIRSSSAKPLVFVVNVTGYRYLSGEGTVTTPAGQTLRFPQ